MRVWIAQCLCPKRHAILATAGEAEDLCAAETAVCQPLRESVATMLTAGGINPWCGLCKAPVETWRYELGRTPFQSMYEAQVVLRESEREHAITRLLFGG